MNRLNTNPTYGWIDLTCLKMLLGKFRLIGVIPLLLTAAVVASSCLLAYNAHVKRQHVMTLESLKLKQDSLETEAMHYQLELSTLSDPVRIESVAKNQLNMTKTKSEESFVQL